MQSTYFGEVRGIGKLGIEQIFYYMDEPILFTALDRNGKRYLCGCCKLGTEYLIVPAKNKTLKDLVANKITLRQAFQEPGTLAITWNGEKTTVLDAIPEDMYPKKGAFLDMTKNEDIVAYAANLERTHRIRLASAYIHTGGENMQAQILIDPEDENACRNARKTLAELIQVDPDDHDLEFTFIDLDLPESIINRIKSSH